MTELLNVAVLGTGRAADMLHGPALRAVGGAQLWSVWSRDRDRGDHFAMVHGAAAKKRSYTDLEELLSDPALDAVVVTTPDETHEALVLAAARAGKHVLCEKPMATSVEAAARMIAACRERGVVLAVGYHHRFHAGHRKAARIVHAGTLGTIRHMRVAWSYRAQGAGGWRSQREMTRWWALSGVGTHCIDMVRWWMEPTCGEVATVRSLLSSPRWKSANEETALVMLRFESGATAEVSSSVLFESTRRVELHADRGTIEARNTLGPYGEGEIHVSGEPLPWGVVNPYLEQLEDFERAIRGDRAPMVSGEDGMKNVEILVHASLSEKRR